MFQVKPNLNVLSSAVLIFEVLIRYERSRPKDAYLNPTPTVAYCLAPCSGDSVKYPVLIANVSS